MRISDRVDQADNRSDDHQDSKYERYGRSEEGKEECRYEADEAEGNEIA